MNNVLTQDLKFVSASGRVAFSGEIFTEKPGEWVIYRVTSVGMLGPEVVPVLYFFTAARRDSVRIAMSMLGKSGLVVYHDSWVGSPKEKWIYAELQGVMHNVKIWSRKVFLLKFLESEFDNYKSRISKDLDVKDYIEVTEERLSGVVVDNNDDESRDARLRVVVASPGQGKTYYMRKLVVDMASRKGGVCPLYINSQQWKGLDHESLKPVWRAIAACFKSAGTPIAWLEGREEEFLRSTLGANICEVFFDGFDEYILSAKTVSAMDVINSLCEMASATNSVITITSREDFWSLVFSEEEFSKGCSIEIIRLKPFDMTSAKEYFGKTIASSSKRTAALGFYKKLKDSSDGIALAGKGITLRLIADLCSVEDREALQIPEIDSAFPLLWIADNICRREVRRQELEPFAQDLHFALLRVLAYENSIGNVVPTDVVVKFLRSNGIKGDLLKRLIGDEARIGALGLHPMFRRDDTTQTWSVRYEQIKYNLLAYHFIASFNVTVQKDNGDLFTFVARLLSQGGAAASNMIECVLDQLFWMKPAEKYVEIARPIIRSFVSFGESCDDDETRKIMARFVVDMAFSVLSRLQRSTVAVDRKKCLLDLLGENGVLRRLQFSGDISSMSFSGVIFEQCDFIGVHFLSCSFDSETKFLGCRFSDVKMSSSDSFVLAVIKDENIDENSRIAFEMASIRKKLRKYTAKNLDNDIDMFLRFFVGRFGMVLSDVPVSNIRSSLVGGSIHFEEILKGFKKYICNAHGVGFSEVLVLKSDVRPAVLLHSENAMYSGKIGEMRKYLRKVLNL